MHQHGKDQMVQLGLLVCLLVTMTGHELHYIHGELAHVLSWEGLLVLHGMVLHCSGGTGHSWSPMLCRDSLTGSLAHTL